MGGVQQSVGAQVTQYLLDTQPGLWQVLASTTDADTTRYVHGPMGLQQQQNPDNAWLYPTQDALGSVRSVADANMAVLESRHYEPYGEPWGVTGVPQTDFGFTGEPTCENGLIYLRARHYDPMLGVFPSLDPLEGEMSRAMSVNRYMWVEGNVANAVDPNGEVSFVTQPNTCGSAKDAVLCPFSGRPPIAGRCYFEYSRDVALNEAFTAARNRDLSHEQGALSRCAMFLSKVLVRAGMPELRPLVEGREEYDYRGLCAGPNRIRSSGCAANEAVAPCFVNRYLRRVNADGPRACFATARVLPAPTASDQEALPQPEVETFQGPFTNAEPFFRPGDILFQSYTDVPDFEHVAMFVGWGQDMSMTEAMRRVRLDGRRDPLALIPSSFSSLPESGLVPWVVDDLTGTNPEQPAFYPTVRPLSRGTATKVSAVLRISSEFSFSYEYLVNVAHGRGEGDAG